VKQRDDFRFMTDGDGYWVEERQSFFGLFSWWSAGLVVVKFKYKTYAEDEIELRLSLHIPRPVSILPAPRWSFAWTALIRACGFCYRKKKGRTVIRPHRKGIHALQR